MATPTRPLMSCWPGYVIGRPVISSCSLMKAMALPGERDRADEHAEEHLGGDVDGGLEAERVQVQELDDGDERCGAAADAVEDGHELWHRGHLDEAGDGDGDGRAEDHGDDGEDEVLSRVAQLGQRERHADGERGGGGADEVARPGPLGRAQELERQDEADDGDEVGEVARRRPV